MFTVFATIENSLRERLSVLEKELFRERERLGEYEAGLDEDGSSAFSNIKDIERSMRETGKALRLFRFIG